MKNCVSINLKKNEIVIKLNDESEQKEIIADLTRKIAELKRLYQDEKL